MFRFPSPRSALVWICLALACNNSSADELRVRIVTANLTSGNNRNYDLGHGARILQGLKPDIALIQEFNIGDGSKTALRQWVNATFGEDFQVFREAERKGIPNGIVSRFPIAESGEWEDESMPDRDFAWAKIGLPGGRFLWAVSVHLSAKSAKKRQDQATALVARIGEKVPDSDYLVLGGDFNTRSRNDPAVQILAALFDTREPYPADPFGDEDTNAGRSEPYDWVVGDRDLHPLQVAVKIGAQTFPNGLVFDSRTFSPLTDVPPVEAADSGAPGMQHMAVVKDFVLPRP